MTVAYFTSEQLVTILNHTEFWHWLRFSVTSGSLVGYLARLADVLRTVAAKQSSVYTDPSDGYATYPTKIIAPINEWIATTKDMIPGGAVKLAARITLADGLIGVLLRIYAFDKMYPSPGRHEYEDFLDDAIHEIRERLSL